MARSYRDKKVVTVPKYGLILCEGETEKNYFDGLVNKPEYKRKLAIDVDIYKPKDHSPKGLVKEAKTRIRQARQERSSYEFVWIVFDRDGHENIPSAFEESRVFSPAINIAFSVVCFEYYILLHFRKTTKAFQNCSEVIKDLQTVMPDYEKATNIFEILEEKMEKGLENCEWCCKMCQEDIDRGKKLYELAFYTDVHKLVNYIINLTKKI